MAEQDEKWRAIKTLGLPHGKVLKIGMWPEDNKVYFSLEELKPEDFVDSDTWEFPISIGGLDQIITEARRHGRV